MRKNVHHVSSKGKNGTTIAEVTKKSRKPVQCDQVELESQPRFLRFLLHWADTIAVTAQIQPSLSAEKANKRVRILFTASPEGTSNTKGEELTTRSAELHCSFLFGVAQKSRLKDAGGTTTRVHPLFSSLCGACADTPKVKASCTAPSLNPNKTTQKNKASPKRPQLFLLLSGHGCAWSRRCVNPRVKACCTAPSQT